MPEEKQNDWFVEIVHTKTQKVEKRMGNQCIACGANLAGDRAKTCGGKVCEKRLFLLKAVLKEATRDTTGAWIEVWVRGMPLSLVEDRMVALIGWAQKIIEAARVKYSHRLGTKSVMCIDCKNRPAVWACDDEEDRCTRCAKNLGYPTKTRKCISCGVEESVTALGYSNLMPAHGVCTTCVNGSSSKKGR